MILRISDYFIQAEHVVCVHQSTDRDGDARVIVKLSSGLIETFHAELASEFMAQWQKLATVEQVQAELQTLQQTMAAQAQQLQQAKAQYEAAIRNTRSGLVLPH